MSVNQFYSSIHRDLFRAGQKSIQDLQSDMIRSALCTNSAKPINLSYNSTEKEPKSLNVLQESNKTTYNFTIHENLLNDSFRHCFNYLKIYRDKGRGLDINIECNVIHLDPYKYHSCNKTYYRADTSKVCNVKRSSDNLRLSITRNNNVQAKEEIQLSKINLTNSDMIVMLMCHLEGKKDMYEKDMIFRAAKHRIIQPIILRSLPIPRISTFYTISHTLHTKSHRLHGQYSLFTTLSPRTSTIPKVHLNSFNLTVFFTILTIIFMLLLVVSIICYIKLRNKRKTFRHVDRSLPEAHGQAINQSFELLESANVSLLENPLTSETHNILSSCHCSHCQIMAFLSKQISEMPDMLFPRCSTDIIGTLGHGNFGSVFKGSLKLGNARSVLQLPFSH